MAAGFREADMAQQMATDPETAEATPDSATLSDADLAGAVAARRHWALREIYRRHCRSLVAEAAKVLGGPAAADDMAHEVLLRLWREPARFDARRGSLRTFLLIDVRGRCRDLMRADAARWARHLRHDERGAVEEPASTGVLRALEAEQVRAALRSIPAAQRDAITLAFFDGYTYREVAQVLGQPEGTVKSRIRAGLHALRGALEPLAAAAC
jgi:RNA polymerase sigma-70 factor (ECF subfamily)